MICAAFFLLYGMASAFSEATIIFSCSSVIKISSSLTFRKLPSLLVYSSGVVDKPDDAGNNEMSAGQRVMDRDFGHALGSGATGSIFLRDARSSAKFCLRSSRAQYCYRHPCIFQFLAQRLRKRQHKSFARAVYRLEWNR